MISQMEFLVLNNVPSKYYHTPILSATPSDCKINTHVHVICLIIGVSEFHFCKIQDQACDCHETCYAGILLSILSYYGVVI